MKDQMQYIVIEGRKPQDGAKPTQALLILPKWISPTLACAGIVGRVIELTDGNIIEQGALPMGEQEVLAELREDARSDAESQMETDDRREQELRAEGVTAPAARPTPGAADAAQQRDDAYREGMEDMRNKLVELLLPFGLPTDAKVPSWLKEQLEELAQFRKDRPETLAKLQAAEDIVAEVRNAKIPVGSNERIAQLELIANNALRDMNNSNDEVCKLMKANEHMREELRNMHAQLLERPNVMNFAGPVTIVQGNPPSVFGPDLSKSAE